MNVYIDSVSINQDDTASSMAAIPPQLTWLHSRVEVCL